MAAGNAARTEGEVLQRERVLSFPITFGDEPLRLSIAISIDHELGTDDCTFTFHVRDGKLSSIAHVDEHGTATIIAYAPPDWR